MATRRKLLSPRLRFAFAPGGLTACYRASIAPQTVAVELQATGTVVQAWPVIMLKGWIDRANMGFASGAEFPVAATSAKLLSGPGMTISDPASHGPSWSWEVELSAVAPLYFRTLVDLLCSPSAHVDATSLRIEGALKLDDSSLSINEQTIRTWLSDRDADTGRPGQIPFPFTERHVSRGAAVRVTFASVPDPAQFDAFSIVLLNWTNAIRRYPNDERDEQGSGTFGVDNLAQSRDQISAALKRFDFAFEPAVNALLGGLVLCHEKILPIRKAEIAF